MHTLHRILVYLPDVGETPSKDDIRSYAEDMTREYSGSCFDYRTIKNAGIWSSQYPDNVVLSKDNLSYFMGELRFAQRKQSMTISRYVKAVESLAKSKDLSSIILSKNARQCGFYLEMIGNAIMGKYTPDTAFFNISEGSALIDSKTFSNIELKPDCWALCYFDCHT